MLDPKILEHAQLLQDIFGRAQADGILVTDVLDAVLAACRTAPAGDNECVRPFNCWNAILIEWQQVMRRDGQIIQITDERAIPVHRNFTAAPPGQSTDSC